jgi:Zn ribbon nucleic-acid-binding protein
VAADQVGTARGADSLEIMVKQVVEVRECARCGNEPAHTWMITGPEGARREIDLCERQRLRPRQGRIAAHRPPRISPPGPRAARPGVDPAAAPARPEPQWR